MKLCILKDRSSNNISVNIQHKLIEAYCWENDIKVLKVGEDDKLGSILVDENDRLNSNIDDSCVLVMGQTKDDNDDDDELKKLDQWIKADIFLPG